MAAWLGGMLGLRVLWYPCSGTIDVYLLKSGTIWDCHTRGTIDLSFHPSIEGSCTIRARVLPRPTVTMVGKVAQEWRAHGSYHVSHCLMVHVGRAGLVVRERRGMRPSLTLP